MPVFCDLVQHSHSSCESAPINMASKIHEDPAVRRTLFFTGLLVLAEPLAATMLLSFVVFMVRDFPAVNERSVAFWCGIISKQTHERWCYWINSID